MELPCPAPLCFTAGRGDTGTDYNTITKRQVDADNLYTLLKKRPCEQWLRSPFWREKAASNTRIAKCQRYQIFYCEDERQNIIKKMELFIYYTRF